MFGLAKELPIGIQNFPTLIKGGYVYVDKTEHYHRLISKGKYYFLSRPRRFGKSLLISTLKEIFEGNRELFKGLWIEDKIDWEPHPVILLDFTKIVSRNTPLDVSLDLEMDLIAHEHGLEVVAGDFMLKFRYLIEQLGAEKPVAILVDEYDKPLIHFIDDEEKLEENRAIMKTLYSVIKGSDEFIAFFMLTGVSKFSQVSIFSDLNNLNDITLNSSFSQMLGYTQTEIENCFPEHLRRLEAELGSAYPDVKKEMKAWYNGYSWDGEHEVFNPFSVLNLFYNNEFGEYWFSTGTPTFLMKLIRDHHISVFELKEKVVSLRAFNTTDITSIEVYSLLFQTGYLTIKKKDKVRQTVTLDFPNLEVANAFHFHLLSVFAEKGREKTDSLVIEMAKYLRQGELTDFMTALHRLFEGIAYPIQPAGEAGIEYHEKYYHSMFYLVLKLLGYDVQVEVLTNTGRLDAVVVAGEWIYIFEFKLGGAEAALQQIKDKHYANSYHGRGKRVMMVGIGFDVNMRNVGKYLVEESRIFKPPLNHLPPA